MQSRGPRWVPPRHDDVYRSDMDQHHRRTDYDEHRSTDHDDSRRDDDRGRDDDDGIEYDDLVYLHYGADIDDVPRLRAVDDDNP